MRKASIKETLALLTVLGIGATGCNQISTSDAQATAAAARQTGIAEGYTSRLATLEAFIKTPQIIVVTATPEVKATTAPTRAPARVVTTAPAVKPAVSSVTVPMTELFKAKDALAYPALIVPDPAREPVFPDVAKGDRKPLAGYETPFANADYFHTGKGEVSLPQYYYRLVTGRHIAIPQLGVDVSSDGRKGALVLLINHFGETATYPDSTAENSFTVAGRVFDMGTPNKMTQAAQALLDHNVGRMVNSADGANCSVIEACKQVEWHVVVVGGGKAQEHWAGLFTK